MKNKTVLAVLCAALGNIIWGVSLPLTISGTNILQNFFPELAKESRGYILLGHRFAISALVMLGMVLLGKNKVSFKGKKWLPIALLMALQLLYYLFETYGIVYTNSTISGLVLAVVPVVTIGTGALLLKEYPTKRQALFCILPVAGVVIISLAGLKLEISNLYVGGLLLLMALLTSAFYKTINRQAALEYSAFERTFFVLSSSAVAFTIIGLKSADWSLAAYVAPLCDIKYLALVSVLGLVCAIAANLLVNYAMSKMSVFKVASFGALSTLCSAIIGTFFMGDLDDVENIVKVSIVIGGVLILVGVRQLAKPPKVAKEEVKRDV